MEIEKLYKFQKTLKLKRSDFQSKSDFALFLKFLNDQIQGEVVDNENSNYRLANEKFTFQSNEFDDFYDEVYNSMSVFEVEINSLSVNKGLRFTYTTNYFIKNNSKITIFSDGENDLNTLANRINSELEKYKNDLRVLTYKVLYITLFLFVFLGLSSSIFDFDNLNSDDFKMNSTTFLDFLIVSILPLFLSMFLYNSSVPTVRIRKNKGFISGFKSYIKQDYRAIMKDIFIAILFLLLGLLIK